MKKSDFIFGALFTAVFLPVLLSQQAYDSFAGFSRDWAFTASFLKFAILATMGEMLGMRIRTGKYYVPGFGLIPRAFVWGMLGVFTKAAFMIFSAGVPSIAAYAGMKETASVMAGGLTGQKIMLSFSISFFLNIIYAPVLMVTHKVTDFHIMTTGGSTVKFFSAMDVAAALGATDWNTMWGFVLKKTIPLFWIPAHTITFLLPAELQILFAALLSTALGLILAIASRKK